MNELAQTQTSVPSKPVGLLILDGWGIRDDVNDNAIAQANTPYWDKLLAEHPHQLMTAHGIRVGLPDGQMGNSEVGHLNLGAGRVVYQDLTRIDKAIADKDFYRNSVFNRTLEETIQAGKSFHIMGLISDGGVHAHINHMIALIKLAAERREENINIHLFTDGRDVAPKSALQYIETLEEAIAHFGVGRIVSVVGRYFALDRDHSWDRTKEAYNVITCGNATYQAKSAKEAVEMAYARGERDEFIHATAIVDENGEVNKMEDGDSIVFMNYRSDRARQLTKAFISCDFNKFNRQRRPKLRHFVTLTEYSKDFHVEVAFPSTDIANTFGEVVSNAGKTQLRTAETEKYAHVTFFFNGGMDEPFEGEERLLVKSPDVATFDLAPEMSVEAVTDGLVDSIVHQKHDTFICNFANPDMVGHTGDLAACIQAVEKCDESMGRIMAAIEAVGGDLIVVADHGNVEILFDESTGQPHTAHTINPVEAIYFGSRKVTLKADGALCDVAPTLLQLMGVEQPDEMSGQSLIASIEV